MTNSSFIVSSCSLTTIYTDSRDLVQIVPSSTCTNSPLKYMHSEDGGSVFKGDEDNHSQQTNQEDYTKFTVHKLSMSNTPTKQQRYFFNPSKEF